MSASFEELDFSPTPIGEVSLRRRRDPVTRQDIFEVKLDDEWLMSSMFTVAEIELAHLGLARLAVNRAHADEGASASEPAWDVCVGGLGLGYTAQAALENPRIRELVVVELLDPVIDWHRRALVPVGPALTGDSRSRLVQGDFFAMSFAQGYDPDVPGRLFDAVLLDIDHSPSHFLDDGSAGFYGADGMTSLASHLAPGGAYAMWSNDPPEQAYLDVLESIFADVTAEVVTFHNPLQDRDATATVYVATKE